METDYRLVCDERNLSIYELGKLLGTGGFGQVFQSKLLGTDRIVAIKRAKKSSTPAMEASILASLTHPHIISCHSYFSTKNWDYIVMELGDMNLKQLLQNRMLTDPEIQLYFSQILSAVEFIHTQKIIHRDLKPANLIISKCESFIKVSDFGISTKLTKGNELKFDMAGTRYYMAPEMLARQGYSYPVDIWTLGCVLYMCFLGRHPFENSKIKATVPIDKTAGNQSVSRLSPEQFEIIKEMLTLDPANRLSAEQLLKTKFFIKCGTT